MTGRALIIAGLIASAFIAGLGGALLFLAVFIPGMLLVGALHKRRYR